MTQSYKKKSVGRRVAQFALKAGLSLLLLAVLTYGAALYLLTTHGAEMIREQLTKAGIEAEFTFNPEGLTTWHLHDVTLTHQATTITLDRARLHIDPLRLNDQPGSLSLGPASIQLPNDAGKVLIESITLTPSALAEQGEVAIAIPSIRHDATGKKRYFTPASLNATAQYDLATQNATFTYALAEHTADWEITGEGDYHWGETPHWQVNYTLPAITFEPGVLQPDHLSPILAGTLQSVRGSLSATGGIAQPAEGKRQDNLTLVLGDLDATINDIPIRGLDGNLQFSSLIPLQSKGQQTLTVDEIMIGLPLSEGNAKLSLTKNTELTVHATRFNWAGGHIATEPFNVNLANMNLKQMQLNAQEVLLEKLLSNLLERGLNATGNLSGKLPVRFESGNPVITGGSLSTAGGGVVRYKPDTNALTQSSNPQIGLLMQAMENFHYDYLNLTINSIDADTLNIKLSTKGRNPNLYGGKAIELNVNLTGNLWDLARSGTQTMGIGKRIEEQLTQ